jgi:hypothetical protein
LRFPSFGEQIHKFKDVITGDITEFKITELFSESANDEQIGSSCIFLGVDLMIGEPDFPCFGLFHEISPLAKMFDRDTLPRLFCGVQSVSAIISLSLITESFSTYLLSKFLVNTVAICQPKKQGEPND